MDSLEAVSAHLVGHFGEPNRTAFFQWGAQVIEVYKWEAHRTGEGVDIYATLGASAFASGDHRIELFTGLTPEQDDMAGWLASVAHYQIQHNVTFDDGHTIPSDEPLWPGTAMDSLLVMRQRAAVIPMLVVGSKHVEFMQIVPITATERSQVHDRGIDLFLDTWEAQGVAFWNSKRA